MDNTEEPEDAPPALLVPAATAATSIGIPPAASKRYPITSRFLCVCVQPAGKAQAYGGLFMPQQYVTVTSHASGRYAMQKRYGCAAQGGVNRLRRDGALRSAGLPPYRRCRFPYPPPVVIVLSFGSRTSPSLQRSISCLAMESFSGMGGILSFVNHAASSSSLSWMRMSPETYSA